MWSPVPDIALLVVARDAAPQLPTLFDDILAQDLERDRFEVVVVDNASRDATPRILADFAERARLHGLRVTVSSCETGVLADGWNEAIKAAHAAIVVRVDAHARIPPEFLQRNVDVMRDETVDVCGGPRLSIPSSGSRTAVAIWLAEVSPFGSGVADYRRAVPASFVSSVAHGAYRRTVFERVGYFNPAFVRTEDNELHGRLRAHGIRIHFRPEITSLHGCRSDLDGVWSQKLSNGFWIGRMVRDRAPGVELHHLAPFALLVGVVAALAAALTVSLVPLVVLAAAYAALLLLAFIMSVQRARSNRYPWYCAALAAGVVALTHTAYAIGTLRGLLSPRRRTSAT